MKIEIHVHIHTTEPVEPVEVEAGPQGTEAYVEHGDHDSTPRVLGFQPNPPSDEGTDDDD